MNKAIYEKTVPVSQLLVDLQNPRLPDIQNSQHDAIKAMVSTQSEKIISLAEHLVDNGPNPASLMIVTAVDNNAEMFYVLDGNRRLTAIKLLESPSLAEGIFDGNRLKKLRQLAAKFEKNPITELNCAVMKDRDEADIWIPLIHRGQQNGAGLVEWDGQVAARYDARKGVESATTKAYEVLDYVKHHANLSEKTRQIIDEGKFPVTNLERLIGTPYVRKKLGFDIVKGQILIKYPESEVLKGLSRVIDDIGAGIITVTKIKTQEQRIDYINHFSEHELPDPQTGLNESRLLGALPVSENNSQPSKTSTNKNSKQIRQRSSLIPKDCRLKINQHRIKKLYTELQQLKLDDFPNAGAVMFRVFIELSVDHLLEHVIKWPEQQINGSTLAVKLEGVINYFETNRIMTSQQLTPVKKAAAGQTLLASAIKTMHGYVHNRYFSPISSELKTAWDDLQPFIVNLWPA